MSKMLLQNKYIKIELREYNPMLQDHAIWFLHVPIILYYRSLGISWDIEVCNVSWLQQLQHLNDEDDNVFEESEGGDYEEIDFDEDEEDIYKVPRNVVS